MTETVLHEQYEYGEEFPSVLARPEGIRSPRHRTIDSDYFTGKQGAMRSLVKILRPGYWAGSIPSSDRIRALPRTYTTAAKVAAGTELTVKDAAIFVVGDTLALMPPNARISITSTSGGWVAGDTVTVTLDGVAIVYTVVADDVGGTLTATNTNVATKVLTAIEFAYPLRFDGAIVAGSSPLMEIVLWSKDGVPSRTISASDTGTNGTAAIVGGATDLGIGGNLIGTVTAVDPVANTLTVGSSSLSLPIGAPIGNPFSRPFTTDGEKLGMLTPNTAVDLLFRPNKHFALWTSCCVYRDRLPYYDGELTSLFPEIELV